MPPSRILLAGYAGQSASHLYHIAVSLGATVVDVRRSPKSRRPEWNRLALKKQMGGYYDGIPAWGNLNYAENDQSAAERYKRIQIADFEAGLTRFERLRGPVILLCGCKDPFTCHRFYLAKRLATQGYKYEQLSWSAIPLPSEEALTLF